jgi:hypothetical protein
MHARFLITDQVRNAKSLTFTSGDLPKRGGRQSQLMADGRRKMSIQTADL